MVGREWRETWANRKRKALPEVKTDRIGSEHNARSANFSQSRNVDPLVMTMRQLHLTVEQRKEKIAFGAVELGYQTLDKLAQHLASQR